MELDSRIFLVIGAICSALFYIGVVTIIVVNYNARAGEPIGSYLQILYMTASNVVLLMSISFSYRYGYMKELLLGYFVSNLVLLAYWFVA